VVNIAVNEQRIVLTRDRRLLYIKNISHGYWVRAVVVKSQVDEVLRRFDLYGSIQPFARCLVCNGVLSSVARLISWTVSNQDPALLRGFYQCTIASESTGGLAHEDMRQRYAVF